LATDTDVVALVEVPDVSVLLAHPTSATSADAAITAASRHPVLDFPRRR
jgi:hypothetical protein